MEYDGVILKPDLDEALEHYGVLGMKWGRRKQRVRNVKTTGKKRESKRNDFKSRFNEWAHKEANKNVNRAVTRQRKKQARRITKGKKPVSDLQLKIMTELNRKRWNDPNLEVKFGNETKKKNKKDYK